MALEADTLTEPAAKAELRKARARDLEVAAGATARSALEVSTAFISS